MTTLFLHVGMHKTGSTAFQHWLAANADALAAAGLAVPRLVGENHSYLLRSAFHPAGPAYAENLRHAGIARYAQDLDALLARLDRFLGGAAAAGRDAILSGEEASLLGEEGYRRLAAFAGRHFDRIVVLGLVRPPLSFAASASQQRLRLGRTLPDLLERPPVPRYRQRFAPAIAVFGRENVRLAPYRPATLENGSVVDTLLAMAGRTRPPGTRETPAARNESVSLTAGKLLAVLNACTRVPLGESGLPEPVRRRLARGPVARRIARAAASGADRVVWRGEDRRLLFTVPGPPFAPPREVTAAVEAASRADCAFMSDLLGVDLAALDDPRDPDCDAAAFRRFEPDEVERIVRHLQAEAGPPAVRAVRRFLARRRVPRVRRAANAGRP